MERRVVCRCGREQTYDGEPGWRMVATTPGVFPGGIPDEPVCPECPDYDDQEDEICALL